jgi:hypothetical protein
MYSIIVCNLIEEDRHRILTSSQPELSVLRAAGFEPAPASISARDPNVARIFDVLALPPSPLPVCYGQMPLSPSNPKFAHRRLWHLPIALILTTFLSAIDIFTSDVEEIQLALQIQGLIQAPILGILGGGGSGSGNDKDDYHGQSPRHSFDQFVDDKLALEQDQNRVGGGNDESGDFGQLLHTI